jgi:hypothetical protein
MKALMATILLLGLGVIARANPIPVDYRTLALSQSNIGIGSSGAMHEDIDSAGAMRERNYFQTQPPFDADTFRCQSDLVLFRFTQLAQSCR